MLEMYTTENFRKEYIDQNMIEIKKQIALGEGHHVDSLAFLSGCVNIDRQNWVGNLKSNMPELYDAQSSDAFVGQLKGIIESDSELNAHCKLPTLS